MSVEIYRVMHKGKLPPKNDMSVKYITEFLDKVNKTDYGFKLMKEREDFGSLYLTAHRLVYSLSEQILEALNTKHK